MKPKLRANDAPMTYYLAERLGPVSEAVEKTAPTLILLPLLIPLFFVGWAETWIRRIVAKKGAGR